jgi:hypothetical protein
LSSKRLADFGRKAFKKVKIEIDFITCGAKVDNSDE